MQALHRKKPEGRIAVAFLYKPSLKISKAEDIMERVAF
jgi:hypothetical protein